MHPYIAYLLISSPANHHARPDERCIGLRETLCSFFRHRTAKRAHGIGA